MNKAFFFDRDGIVNIRLVDDYVKQLSEFIFIEDYFSFLKLVKEKKYLTILITNQQGIGKGLMNDIELAAIHDYMQSELIKYTGYNFDDIYYCSELEESNSFRRKPNPGMILEAVEKWNISLTDSWMVGDSEKDILAGKRAGMNTILIAKNIETTDSDYVFNDINEATNWISKHIN